MLVEIHENGFHRRGGARTRPKGQPYLDIQTGSWEGPLQARKGQGKGHARLFAEWVGMLRGMWKKQSAWEEAEDRSGARPGRMRE